MIDIMSKRRDAVKTALNMLQPVMEPPASAQQASTMCVPLPTAAPRLIVAPCMMCYVWFASREDDDDAASDGDGDVDMSAVAGPSHVVIPPALDATCPTVVRLNVTGTTVGWKMGHTCSAGTGYVGMVSSAAASALPVSAAFPVPITRSVRDMAAVGIRSDSNPTLENLYRMKLREGVVAYVSHPPSAPAA